MHRHRIVAQISVILSILNLVLAAPMEVQGIHETPSEDSEETVVAENAPATDVVASPQHSSLSDGSMSSGYPPPYLPKSPAATSVPGYSWLSDRVSLDESASLSPQGLAPERPIPFPFPQWSHKLGPSPSASFLELPPLHHPSSSGPSQILPQQLEGLDQYSHGPMRTSHLSAFSDGSLSSQYHTASEGPPHHLTPDPQPPLSQASSPQASVGTLSDNSEFLNGNLALRKVKIIAGLVIIGSAIAAIVGSRLKNRDNQDR